MSDKIKTKLQLMSIELVNQKYSSHYLLTFEGQWPSELVKLKFENISGYRPGNWYELEIHITETNIPA